MYYVLGRAPKPGRWIGNRPFIKGLHWRRGALITQTVPDPLKFTLKPLNPESSDHSPHMPAYFDADSPLFRDDLVQAMKDCGIDNLQYFNALIEDPDDGRVYTSYKAVNIIGLVAATDMEKSQATVHSGPPLIDVEFDNLVVDDSKARGLLIFRLAEATMAILVHQRLRDLLKERGFDDLVFHEPGEVAL